MRRMFLIITVIQLAAAGFVAHGQARIIASTRFRTYSLADLSAEARNDFLGLDKAIADERTELLTDQLDALLFATEARSRGITIDQLKSIEIKSRVSDPVEMTAKAYYEAYRTAESKTFDEETTKILKSLRRQREQERTQAYIGELEKKYGVTRPKDVNAGGLNPTMSLRPSEIKRSRQGNSKNKTRPPFGTFARESSTRSSFRLRMLCFPICCLLRQNA